MTPDLVQIFFRVIFKTSLRYRTDELKDPAYAYQYEGRFPPVTGYRLMTSMTVSVLGIFKAYLAYKNSPSADTLDWICGIVVTSL